jgi:Subtilase family.
LTPADKYKIISNDYMDLVIMYNGNPDSLKKFEQYSPHLMNVYYAVLYIPVAEVTPRLLTDYGYNAIPKCYTLLDMQSLAESGVTKLRTNEPFNLRGNGVIVGIVDTGIDYTNPVFQKADGTTRIISIWDQTIDSVDQYPKLPFSPYYGTEYTADQINQALKSANPLEVVPTVDEISHGTKLAGIAAGNENKENNFSGVAPNSDLLIVKLKQAKNNLRDYYSIPPDVPCYQENDLIWGVQYLIDMARILNRPVSVCIGLGTSQGAHNDSGNLNDIVSVIGDFNGVSITAAAGNEGNARRHFSGTLDQKTSPLSIELTVSEKDKGFTMEIWGDPPLIFSVDILSPSGEYVPTIYGRLEETRTIRFIFEQTIILIDYILIEEETGKQAIIMRFKNISSGTWKFQLTAKNDWPGAIHSWLPAGNFISNETYFLQPNANITLTSPANSTVPMTIVAYDSDNGALYTNSSKGFTTSDIINPDFAAPGVNLTCPGPNHSFTTITGTSAAAAHTTGIAAMILEWGIVNNNYKNLDTIGIKKFLIRGAKRNPQLKYPNTDWGYGIVDVFNAFSILRSEII